MYPSSSLGQYYSRNRLDYLDLDILYVFFFFFIKLFTARLFQYYHFYLTAHYNSNTTMMYIRKSCRLIRSRTRLKFNYISPVRTRYCFRIIIIIIIIVWRCHLNWISVRPNIIYIHICVNRGLNNINTVPMTSYSVYPGVLARV